MDNIAIAYVLICLYTVFVDVCLAGCLVSCTIHSSHDWSLPYSVKSASSVIITELTNIIWINWNMCKYIFRVGRIKNNLASVLCWTSDIVYSTFHNCHRTFFRPRYGCEVLRSVCRYVCLSVCLPPCLQASAVDSFIYVDVGLWPSSSSAPMWRICVNCACWNVCLLTYLLLHIMERIRLK